MRTLEQSVTSSYSTERSDRWARLMALAGLVVFVVMTVLVETHALIGLDVAIMLAKSQAQSTLLLVWSQAVGVLLSAELSVIYTAIAVYVLIALGLRWWALAPTLWLPGTVVEAALKLTIHQPHIPPEYILRSSFHLTNVDLPGSFPSGHAMRTAFLLLFIAIILWTRGGMLRRFMAAGMLLISFAGGYARVYMGYHWASDVVAGMALGFTLALLVAPQLSRMIVERGRARTRPR